MVELIDAFEVAHGLVKWLDRVRQRAQQLAQALAEESAAVNGLVRIHGYAVS